MMMVVGHVGLLDSIVMVALGREVPKCHEFLLITNYHQIYYPELREWPGTARRQGWSGF